MLVEDLDVIAGVFLRREGVEVPAKLIDLLRDVLGGTEPGALEDHVLHEMRDAAVLDWLVARTPGEPDAYAHRPDVVHGLGDETDPVVEDLADDHRRTDLSG